ncbi:HupE/UreJ family protein [Luteimonas vadosa]|uniref:HupE/UreJ family protein n=1 Tax=Luteimonas vadosa TaxID=1165507 RepID=A0ABP9E6Y8_9GAMM
MSRWLLTLLLVLFSSPAAWAHSLSTAHLDITRTSGGATQVELDLAILDLALTFPVDANRDEQVTWGELSSANASIEAWVLSNLALSASGRPCRLAPEGLAVRRYDDGAYANLRFDADCAPGSALGIDYGLFFDRDPQHRALVQFHDVDGTVSTTILHASQRKALLGRGNGPGTTFRSFLREGIHHILIGYDHVAFLLSLLLTAALLRVGGQWTPAPRYRQSALHTLGIVTAFTVAHSITLTLAALGLVTPASRWIEATIAASVLVAALNNLWPLVSKRLWALGFAFGLIHGFGFAGALGELGLPEGERLTALLAFNLGVELGQLCIVAVLLPILFAVRKQAWYPRIAMPAMSLAIAALAGFWLMQRLAG